MLCAVLVLLSFFCSVAFVFLLKYFSPFALTKGGMTAVKTVGEPRPTSPAAWRCGSMHFDDVAFYPKVARLALIGERLIGQRVVLHWTHPLPLLNTYYKIRSVISACNIISLIFSFPISKFSTSSNDRSLAISPPSYIQISYLSL